MRNYLAYRGVTAPHTNAPYSEAMLLGVSEVYLAKMGTQNVTCTPIFWMKQVWC